jgi:hypothetical protein
MHITTDHSARRLQAVTARAKAGPTGRSPALRREPPTLRLVARSNVDETADPTADDRRRSARVPVSAEVCIRRVGSANYQVRLFDVSTGGCRVELAERCGVDDDLVARLPQLEPLGAQVRWTQGAITGVQFLSSIHAAVFDSLVGRLAEAEKPRPL